MISDRIALLAARLDGAADPARKTGADAYLKHLIPHRGVRTPVIRSIALEWRRNDLADAELPELRDLGFALLREYHAEDKVAGMVLLGECVIPRGGLAWEDALPGLAAVFDQGFVNNWATCDALCSRVLTPLIKSNGMECARAVLAWREAENVWRRRAAVVAFVSVARHGEAFLPGLPKMLLESCGALLPDEERFINTGVGWALRELGRADPDAVLAFVESRLGEFSAEGLRYALEKRDPALRRELCARRAAMVREHRRTARR